MYVVPDAAPLAGVKDSIAVVVDTELAEPIVGASNVVVILNASDDDEVPTLFVAVIVNEYVVLPDKPDKLMVFAGKFAVPYDVPPADAVYDVPEAAPVGGVNDIFAVVVDTAVAEPIVGADSAVVKLTAVDEVDVPALLVVVAVNE